MRVRCDKESETEPTRHREEVPMRLGEGGDEAKGRCPASEQWLLLRVTRSYRVTERRPRESEQISMRRREERDVGSGTGEESVGRHQSHREWLFGQPKGR